MFSPDEMRRLRSFSEVQVNRVTIQMPRTRGAHFPGSTKLLKVLERKNINQIHQGKDPKHLASP